LEKRGNERCFSDENQSTLQTLGWSDKSTNYLTTSMMTFLPLLCWLELNANWPSGVFYHPVLSVNKLLRIDFETQRDILGGGDTLWGSDID